VLLVVVKNVNEFQYEIEVFNGGTRDTRSGSSESSTVQSYNKYKHSMRVNCIGLHVTVQEFQALTEAAKIDGLDQICPSLFKRLHLVFRQK